MLDPILIDRFWSKVDKRAADECWPWLGGLNHKGYGVFCIGSKSTFATHTALLLDGRKRQGMDLACHTCDNPPCVNPAHLWWGTNRDNMIDSVAKKRHVQARKTVCPKGHPLSGDNILAGKLRQGSRECRICYTERKAKRTQARRAAEGVRERLILPLKTEYFDQIKSGEKTEEYRLANTYWRRRLAGVTFKNVILTRAYPKGGGIEGETRLTRKWAGCTVKTITHPHFGPNPVEVFAIGVCP